jgi:hypothetical protein
MSYSEGKGRIVNDAPGDLRHGGAGMPDATTDMTIGARNRGLENVKTLSRRGGYFFRR